MQLQLWITLDLIVDIVQNSLCGETENVVPGWSCPGLYMQLKGLNNHIVYTGALLSGGVFGEERPAVGTRWKVCLRVYFSPGLSYTVYRSRPLQVCVLACVCACICVPWMWCVHTTASAEDQNLPLLARFVAVACLMVSSAVMCYVDCTYVRVCATYIMCYVYCTHGTINVVQTLDEQVTHTVCTE